ncbi:hypothetical protein ACTWP4_02965 [Gracilibacillus sp. D59]|uniref:hypothetical protein n=1 Tax=Gracilibacillus sp. D59 TaxID=3457434 RepID=UPI003FCC77D4
MNKNFKNPQFNHPSEKNSDYLNENHWNSFKDYADDLDIEYEFEGFINKKEAD